MFSLKHGPPQVSNRRGLQTAQAMLCLEAGIEGWFMKLVLYTVLISASFGCNENQNSQTDPLPDVQGASDQEDSSTSAIDTEINRPSDVNVRDQNLRDALTIDMAVVCQPRDCGMRPEGVVEMCTNQESEIRLVGCARTPSGECEWLTQACPEPCVGRDCPQPCEPLEDFDAGDGCNTCQCPATGERQNSVCTQFNCEEIGCRSDADCTERGFCDFPDDQCGAQGVRGVCSGYPDHCSERSRPSCGCDGTFGSACTDHITYGGCPLPGTLGDVACMYTVCRPEEQFCLVTQEDLNGDSYIQGSCESIPVGCEPTDCSCFQEKLPTHVCYRTGNFIIMIPRHESR